MLDVSLLGDQAIADLAGGVAGSRCGAAGLGARQQDPRERCERDVAALSG
jgi:hypothetical protein